MSIKKYRALAVSALMIAGFTTAATAGDTYDTEPMKCYRVAKEAQVKVQDILNKAGYDRCGILANQAVGFSNCGLDGPKKAKPKPDRACFSRVMEKTQKAIAKRNLEAASAVNGVIFAAQVKINAFGKEGCDAALDDAMPFGPYSTDESGKVTEEGASAAGSDISGLAGECDGDEEEGPVDPE